MNNNKLDTVQFKDYEYFYSILTIKKLLKAFDIIKDKLNVVNYGTVCNDSKPEYWLLYNGLMLKKLTYGEYELLKEIL